MEKAIDPDASPVLGLQSNNLLKRRAYSRNHKKLGDYFLLCGFTKSAISNYLLASEGIKATEDPLWQASVQEGLLTANLVKLVMRIALCETAANALLSFALDGERHTDACARAHVELQRKVQGHCGSL